MESMPCRWRSTTNWVASPSYSGAGLTWWKTRKMRLVRLPRQKHSNGFASSSRYMARWMKRGGWEHDNVPRLDEDSKIGCVALLEMFCCVQGQWLIGLKGLQDPANLRGFRFLGKHAPHVRPITPAFQGKANALMAIVVSLPTRKSRCRSKQAETMSWSIHQEGEAQHWSRLSTVQVDKTSQVTIATRRSFKCYGIPEGDIAGQMGSNMGKQCCSC